MELRALDAAGIKAHLPIVYVLDRYRIPVEDSGDGRWAAVCPFHPDSDPSLDVFGERLERWGCFPCGARGDVFDLIERLAWPEAKPSFADVRRYALVLLDELERSDWTGPTEGVARVFDLARATAVVNQSRVNDIAPVRRFLAVKHSEGSLLGITAEWLQERWGVGSRLDEIIIPYYRKDGTFVSYKHRTARTKALSPPGRGQFDGVLYGEWADDGQRPVIVCEGESDTWQMAAAVGDRFAVLGLPTGSGDHPTRATTLAGRTVIMALDGDEAGWRGTCAWLEALGEYGADASYLEVPDGKDLADLPLEYLRDLAGAIA